MCLTGAVTLCACASMAQEGAPAGTQLRQPGVAPARASQPFVKDGLQVTVMPGKAAFALDEPLTFNVQFKNVSDKGFLLFEAAACWRWKIQFLKDGENGPWQLMLWKLVPTFEEQQNAVRTLRPGDELAVPVTLDPVAAQYCFVWAGPARGETAARTNLQPGTHRLTVALELKEPPGQREWALPFWTGQVATAPVDVQIAARRDRGRQE
jgi:hypothetical protein